MDTLAFGYLLPAAGRIRVFHPLETCAAGRTMKMVCAHIIGTDHFLFNVAGVVIFFYIVLITIEPV